MILTINLPNRPKDDPIEVVGLGLFANGYNYELDGDEPDQVHGDPLDAPPVKPESTNALSPAYYELMELSHTDLDELAEESKVTFGSKMTKHEKALALAEGNVDLSEED